MGPGHAAMLAAALSGMPGAIAPPDAAVPLRYSGKWTVRTAANGCLLERSYGPADRPTLLSFTPGPLGTRVGVGLLESHRVEGRIVRSDAGSVTLAPGGRVLPATMRSFGPMPGRHRLTTTLLAQVSVRDLILSPVITFDRGKAGPAVSIAPSGSVEAADALDRCESDLLHRLGIDPATAPALSRAPQPVGGTTKGWFRSEDYPRNVAGLLPVGRAVARVMVETDGRVRRCVILQGSGNDAIDERTCAALRTRARYVPALDPAGVPIAAPAVVPVNWQPHR